MDLMTFIKAARVFTDLGDAVSDQLVDVMNGGALEDQNQNALKLIVKALARLNAMGVDGASTVADEIKEYLSTETE